MPLTLLPPSIPSMWSQRVSHASLGWLCVPMSESVRRESLNTSIPTPLWLPAFPPSNSLFPFPSQQHHLAPCVLFVPPIPIISPNRRHFSPFLISGFLTVNAQQVKQPHNRSGALSLIMASVYYRSHALPHHQPIFPHRKTHIHMHPCIYAHRCTSTHTYMC